MGGKKSISGFIQDLSGHVQSLIKFSVLVCSENLVFCLSLKMSPAGQRHWLMGKVSPLGNLTGVACKVGKPIQSKSEIIVLPRSFTVRFVFWEKSLILKRCEERLASDFRKFQNSDVYAKFWQDHEVNSGITPILHRANLNCGKAICYISQIRD